MVTNAVRNSWVATQKPNMADQTKLRRMDTGKRDGGRYKKIKGEI